MGHDLFAAGEGFSLALEQETAQRAARFLGERIGIDSGFSVMLRGPPCPMRPLRARGTGVRQRPVIASYT